MKKGSWQRKYKIKRLNIFNSISSETLKQNLQIKQIQSLTIDEVGFDARAVIGN